MIRVLRRDIAALPFGRRLGGGTGEISSIAASMAKTIALGTLLGFHVALFYAHLVTGRLFAPDVALRWTAGILIVGAFVALRRADVPILWGRRAVGLWALVALLHWQAFAADSGASLAMEASEPAVTALAASLVAPAVTLLVLLVIAAVSRRRALVPASWWTALGSGASRPTVWRGHLWSFSPRPPPRS